MLRLIFIVILEVNARPDQVKRMCDHAACCIGRKRCSRGYHCQLNCSVRLILTLSLEAKDNLEVLFEEVVNWIEDAREGNVSDQRYLKASKEASWSLLE